MQIRAFETGPAENAYWYRPATGDGDPKMAAPVGRLITDAAWLRDLADIAH